MAKNGEMMSETLVRSAIEKEPKKQNKTDKSNAMLIERYFTKSGVDPLNEIVWERRSSVITNPDGSIVFKLEGAEIPAHFSQLATDIVVSKYFRKAGLFGDKHRGEQSVREVVSRIAKTIRWSGEQQGGYFASTEEADTFEAELSYLLVNQMGAFNSPVWFNCGLWHQYEIPGSGGAWAWSEQQQEVFETPNAYERPQCSACFIQSVKDDLMSIYELVKTEARLFKYGSGTGSNFSSLRGKQEKLSGGGTSSGLMSFLEVLDRAAGATKSGGTTRRAAKMVCLDMDHPEIVDFIEWKMREERKAHALIAGGYPADFNGEAYRTVSGQNSNNSVRVTDDFMKTLEANGTWTTRFRTTGEAGPSYAARDLWNMLSESAWGCADPGVQYDTTINKWHTCPNTAPIRASNPCVTGDTLVATAQGWQRIDSMLDHKQNIIGADGQLHAIAPAFATGTKPIYQLRTRAGYALTLTADHRVLTLNRGDVPACELTKDDVLPLSKGCFGQEQLDERIAEFLGLMVGDGCISGTQEIAMLTLSPEEHALAKYIHEQITSFKREFAEDARAARDIEVTAPQSTLRLATSARCVIEPLKKFACLDQGSAKKSFNELVFKLDKASIAAILRGVFTADGTVADYGDKSQYVALDSTSLKLLQQVQLLLLGFGIKAKLYCDRRIVGQKTALLPDGKGGQKEYPVQQVHSLRISRGSRVLFEQEIGFILGSEKQEHLALLNSRVSTYQEQFTDRVESLTFVGEAPVFDLTEPNTHHFVAGGLVVHNCSEYMFLDDSACNLASLNLTKFLGEDGTFDIEAYRHAIRVFFMAQEILVDLSSYPTKVIAKNSRDYRPLGLGYANLGTLLMIQGVPYDSAKGRAICAALTAILTGHAYYVSAEMAKRKNPFAGYTKNREPFLRVMNMHRDAAYGIDRDACPDTLFKAACDDWDHAVTAGQKHGYRNAQATVLAPTGCLVAGSLVATEKGLVRIETLGNTEGEKWQDVSFQVATDEGPQKATKFYVNGVDDVIEVVTENGYSIKGTPKHRVKVVQTNGAWAWKRFSELTEGDLVPMPLGTLFGEPVSVALPEIEPAYKNRAGSYCAVPCVVTKDLAELVGLFMGDGSLHERGLRFSLAKEDQDSVAYTTALIEKVFSVKAHISNEGSYACVTLNSTRIARWWAACGFAKLLPTEDHTGKGYDPIIPDAILATNDPAIYGAFLRGLFDTDGTVNLGVPGLSTKSKRFAQEVIQVLLALGIPVANVEQQIGGKSGNPVYRIRLANAHYVKNFNEKIGFISQRKTSLLQTEFKQVGRHDHIPVTEELLNRVCPPSHDLRKSALAAFGRTGGLTRHMAQFLATQTKDKELTHLLGFFFTQVTSAELIGREPTFDLSVPENVTYIANGFISHNTIGLLMDCDTTGIEPDFALVKFKKLAGGGYFKIVNQSVPQALRMLGYSESQTQEILAYISGTNTLLGAPVINRASLKARGFTDEDLSKVENNLLGSFELRSAFASWVLGEETYRRLGVPVECIKHGFDLLSFLGFTSEQIDHANDHIIGRMTIEGAPYLRPEHEAVFDCANRCGKIGKRFLAPVSHLRMMAAAQPFLSGAISKTVNLPNEATVEEIGNIYYEGWKLGLKAVALYRDGCKMSQPLSASASSSKEEKTKTVETTTISTPIDMIDEAGGAGEETAVPVVQVAKQSSTMTQTTTTFSQQHFYGERMRLPTKRRGFTQEARVGGHKIFLRTGEYDNGRLGEIFIDMHKEGAAFRSMMNCFAMAVSVGLQYGVPLETYVEQFTFTRFEPQGTVEGHPNIKLATSIVDYIFRVLGVEYLHRYDLCHVQPAKTEDPGERTQTSTTFVKAEANPTQTTISTKSHESTGQIGSLDAQLEELMGDAPVCDVCGHITVRNGACYRCLNCGNSMGCS